MRLGASERSRYAHLDGRSAARAMVARAAAAEAAGLDSLFVGDHHVTPDPYLQNVPVLGRMLAAWGPRTAGALFLLPLWPPVLVAEQVASLASIAEGRFVLQCAIGDGRSQFAGMGASVSERRADFEHDLDVIRRLLAGEAVDGRLPRPFGGALVRPLPPEPVAVWIGGSARPAIERAARLGDGWIAGPWSSHADLLGQLRTYRRCREELGLDPGVAVVRRDVHVADDRQRARDEAAAVLAAGYRGFGEGVTVVGDADEVTDELATLAAMGYDEVLVRHLVDDEAAVHRSYALLGEVRLRLAGAGPAPAR